jgi:hypothetical protein
MAQFDGEPVPFAPVALGRVGRPWPGSVGFGFLFRPPLNGASLDARPSNTH